jgi:hypothetical protein
MALSILNSLLPNKRYIFETQEGRSEPIKLATFSQSVTEDSPKLIAIYGNTKAPSNIWSELYGWNPAELHRTINTVISLVTLKESAAKNKSLIENSIMGKTSPLTVINTIIAKHGVELLSSQYGYLEFKILKSGAINRVKLMPMNNKAEVLSIYGADNSKSSCEWETDLLTTIEIHIQRLSNAA